MSLWIPVVAIWMGIIVMVIGHTDPDPVNRPVVMGMGVTMGLLGLLALAVSR